MPDGLYDHDALAWADQQAAHWTSEAVGLLIDAQDAFSPAMRQRISLEDLYAKALHQAHLMNNDAGQPRPLPDGCPFALDDLLAERPDAAALAARLAVVAESEESRPC